MKKYSNYLVFTLMLFTLLIPSAAVNANLKPAQDEEIHFTIGQGTYTLQWDPAIYQPSLGDTYRFATLENLVTVLDDWDGTPEGVLPMLATDFEIEYWPEETNSRGFVNRGGIKAMNFTLRENVLFHDGSIWNATVAKWNIDRWYVITGDLTGNGDTSQRSDYYINVNDNDPFYTPSYNLSWGKGKVASYNGMIAPGPINSSNPLWEHVPKINNTQILVPGDPVNGGGRFRIEWNEWNAYPFLDTVAYTTASFNLMISMEAYKENYTDAAFYGYGAGSLIGTGPYIFDHHTASGPTTGGLLLKNENYWDKANWESLDLFAATHVEVVLYSDDDAGRDARNLAFYNYNLDYVGDYNGWEVGYDNVIIDPNLKYNPSLKAGIGPLVINFNCINETYWKTAFDAAMWDGTDPAGNVGLGGIPRLFRKAISYAFDYDSYIQTAYSGRAYRMDNWMGVNNTYNQKNIPIAYTNLTIAREAMLGAFPTECAARGLNSTNLDDDTLWRSFATSNPIFTFNFYWDIASANVIIKDELINALEELGCDMWLDYPGDVYADNEFASVWGSFAGGVFPYFLHNGFTGVTWPHYNGDDTYNYLYQYYRNIGDFSFQMGFNAAHIYLDNVTQWLDQVYYSNRSQRQVLYDDIGRTLQNYAYPWVYICQTIDGIAIKSEWEVNATAYGNHLANLLRIKYLGTETIIPEIPGFIPSIMMATSLVAMMGVILVIKRRKRI